MTPKLPAHEWLIICLLITALLLLSFVTLVWRKDELPPIQSTHDLTMELVQVTVQGAVERAGIYELKKGCKLKELWDLCRPLPDADLSRFKPNSLLRDGQVVKVPAQEYITIYLEGAVSPVGALQVLKETKLKELKHLVHLQPNADGEKLDKMRRLRDQETIHISIKKEVKSKAATKARRSKKAEEPKEDRQL